MAERLALLFSSPKFKDNRSFLPANLPENVSPLHSSARYNSTQDELSLEMDAKSEGFTSRICDTANSLLLGEFPWGTDKQSNFVTIKHRRMPKPVPVRLHIGPPNSNSLLMTESDNSEYENDEYNCSKSLLQALREMTRKRSHSIMMNEESDNDVDCVGAASKKCCKSAEPRHNLYLSQLEEETQEYKNNMINRLDSQHLERPKRGRDEDNASVNTLMMDIGMHDKQNKRQCTINTNDSFRTAMDERNSSSLSCTMVSANDLSGSRGDYGNRIRRGSNEIVSSLSSSLTLLDPAVLKNLLKPSIPKVRRKKQKKSVSAQTQTLQPVPEDIINEIKEKESPLTEDKSINTEPEILTKSVTGIVQEQVVTDKMANALMKSAVSKFLATEDPALSPKRNPTPPPPTSAINSPLDKPTSVCNTINNSVPPMTPLPIPSINVQSTLSNAVNTATVSTSSSTSAADKPTFNFGTSNLGFNFISTAAQTIPSNTLSATAAIAPFTFGTPTVSNSSVTSATTLSFPTSPIVTQANLNVSPSNKLPTDSTNQIVFGEKKLAEGFKLAEGRLETKTADKTKSEEVNSENPFKQSKAIAVSSAIPTAVASSAMTSPISTTSELVKGTFSFGFSPSSSTPSNTNSNEPGKVPTFSFGGANSNLPKFNLSPSTFGTSNETTKPTPVVEPQKLPNFGAGNEISTTNTTTKPAVQMLMRTVGNNIGGNTGTFQFGGANVDKKDNNKPEESKLQGLFTFGSVQSNTSTAKTEAKPFSFGTATPNTTTTAETSQPQQAKPMFQFGTSSFSAPQTNNAFGSKPAEPFSSTTPNMGFNDGGLFGAKPSMSSTPAAATTTAAATTSGLFGFGSVQPSVTSVTPTFGSTTSTTNSTFGSGFQQNNKPEQKSVAPSTGFSFKFTGGGVNGTTTTTTDPSKPTFNFGTSSIQTPQAPSTGFGTNSITQQPTFGSQTTSPTPLFSGFSSPTFGSTVPQTSAPVFGSTVAPTPAPVFGSTTTPASFGTSSVNNTQPSSSSSLFGTMGSQPLQGPNFTFGATTTAPPNNSGGGFNFSATVQPTTQPASTAMFQFGASSNQQNPAGGVQPFQFSAGPSTMNPPGFGFPTPVGGFNPGVGGGQPMFSIGSGSTAPRSRQQFRRKK